MTLRGSPRQNLAQILPSGGGGDRTRVRILLTRYSIGTYCLGLSASQRFCHRLTAQIGASWQQLTPTSLVSLHFGRRSPSSPSKRFSRSPRVPHRSRVEVTHDAIRSAITATRQNHGSPASASLQLASAAHHCTKKTRSLWRRRFGFHFLRSPLGERAACRESASRRTNVRLGRLPVANSRPRNCGFGGVGFGETIASELLAAFFFMSFFPTHTHTRTPVAPRCNCAVYEGCLRERPTRLLTTDQTVLYVVRSLHTLQFAGELSRYEFSFTDEYETSDSTQSKEKPR